MRAIALVLLVASMASDVSVGAQDRIRSVTEAVRLDVLVTDGRKPIRGLTAKDFTVRDLSAPQQIRVEAASGGAVDVILTLDVSDSLSPARLAALKAAARQVIELLGPDDRIQIVTFNHLIALRSPLESTRAASLAALDDLVPAGRTALRDAVFAALMSVPPPVPDRRTLQVVLSDGEDSASWLSEAQVRWGPNRPASAAVVRRALSARPRGA